jgi:ABC-type antimicrobial peptide transport system permease subunit
LLASISSGSTLGHTADVTHGLTSRMVGHVEGINQLLDITFSDETD